MTSKESPLVSSLEKILSQPVFQKAIAKALAESLASTFEDIQQDRADLADHMAQAATPSALQTGISHTIVRGTGNRYWDGTRVEILAVCGKTKKCKIRKVYGGEITWTDCDAVEPPDFGDSKEVSPSKRYREPTLEDLANGPVCCEVRDWDSEQWKDRQLIQIHKSGPFRFLCKNEPYDNPLNWNQCRIELPKQSLTPKPPVGLRFRDWPSDSQESSTPEPPDGWRFLEFGEVLRKGDNRYKNFVYWDLERGHVGDLVSDSFNTGFIRRNRFEVGEKVIDCRTGAVSTVQHTDKQYPIVFLEGVTNGVESKHLAPYIEDSK